ncbi:hypothetical protein DFR67_12629 [Williamsia limnetica]|uniref:Uncharacterized protein n=1 Tax=Williamsia limnetica TaxID=882452 RepID=A0A318RBP9_WILLI|nr:hypothetical protein [Williamsia limnetica]PYE12021.1 hypothetical protein DFR67_12629 [Williamsia limnetica]
MTNDSAPTLNPPHPGIVDPGHFAAGDRVVFGHDSVSHTADTQTSIVVSGVATDTGCIALRGAHVAGGDVYQTSIGNVLHATGCDACDQCAAARQRADTYEYQEQRSLFNDNGLARADALRENGLAVLSSAGRGCGHGDTYTLAADAPVPQWMHTALAGVVFSAPEGPWPNWGRTDAPIDWPALIAAHPDGLDVDPGVTDDLHGASWTSIVEAFALARSTDPQAALDVCLWVDTDSTVLVEPAYLHHCVEDVGRIWHLNN